MKVKYVDAKEFEDEVKAVKPLPSSSRGFDRIKEIIRPKKRGRPKANVKVKVDKVEKIQEIVEKKPVLDDKKKQEMVEDVKKLGNPIEEYFADKESSKEVLTSKELFRANKEDVDIKTDLTWKEIVLVNKLKYNDMILKQAGLNPVFSVFLDEYLRLKISLDRKSRGEFVSMNQHGKPDEALKMPDVNAIAGTRK